MDEHALVAAGFHAAPLWSTVAGMIGKGLIILSGIAFLVALVGGLLTGKAGRFTHLVKVTFVTGSASLFGAMATLAALFVGDQFQFEYVAGHSWKQSAIPYKVAAIWAGQQGSFLLWACCSAIFGLITFRKAGIYQRWYLVTFSTFLCCLSAILAFETPFGTLEKMVQGGILYVPLNGIGLVPSLQNYWVVIHPPIIFLGFGSLTVMFAYAVSAMLTGDMRSWVPIVRPWTLVSLAILGLGLVLGGLWAYETQGWGGFWAWDPVENVSFVPWLMVAALVHGSMVQVAQKKWFGVNLLLGGAPFLLFVYGTFLTRSGYLDKFSVHSFAQMNRVALWVLFGFLALALIGFIGLWIGKGLRQSRILLLDRTEEPSPRGSGFTAGTILLTVLSLSIGIGMSVPFFYGLMGKDAKVVDEPLYHQVVVWFFIPIMLLMAITPFLSWRNTDKAALSRKFWSVIGIAFLLLSFVLFGLHQSNWSQAGDASTSIRFPFGVNVPRAPWVLLLAFLTAVTVAANTLRVGELFKRSKLGIGGFLAHIGVAVTLGGLIVSRGMEQKQQILIMEGTPGQGLGYHIQFDHMTSHPETDATNKAVFAVSPTANTAGQSSFHANASYFFTPGDNGKTDVFTSPAIEHTWSHDIYFALETPQINLWDMPETFSLGETKEGSGVSVTYLGIAQHGEAGQKGASFGAKLKVIEDGVTYFGEPKITLGSGPDSPKVSPSLRATLTGMNANDGSIQLQMPYTHILFPVQLFYKPMTVLIWIGLFFMTVGGLLSAFYRRS